VRNLSLNFRRALFAQESAEVGVMLLTITHDNFDEIFRLSSDPTQRITTDPLRYGTISRGETFFFVQMDLQLPDERDRDPPKSRMIIANLDRDLIPLVRSVTSPAQVKIECVLASAPDFVEFDVPQLDLINVDYNALTLSFDLAMDALAIEPFPAGSFDPASFPGLFGT
jgi:hypothetical protein